MMKVWRIITGLLLCTTAIRAQHAGISLATLLHEMADRQALARFPEPSYASLQASSYNRASVARDEKGWFADEDGLGFIRTETMNGSTEWVVMEHNGPGAITRIWAPDFYHGGLDDLEGPRIRIYLDGSAIPVIDENFFRLITGRGAVPSPLANRTARAGDLYLPIPFGRSCKVTFDNKPFYYCISYRAYPAGVKVSTFTRSRLEQALTAIDTLTQSLFSVMPPGTGPSLEKQGAIAGGSELSLHTDHPGAIGQLEIQVDPEQVRKSPALLRNVVLVAEFDHEQTVWAPLGDFFGSPNALHPFQTWTRTVYADGHLYCSWVMPFRSSARISLRNLGPDSVHIRRFAAKLLPWKWDHRSMYFHASWRGDDIVQGSAFQDWNFITVKGKGVLAGDAWTVLCPDAGWWGEGDEKIYVDDAYDKRFPTLFGTGTEDYYGWAGGEVPLKSDRFSHPYLANILVGDATEKRQGVRGFNICTRVRSLDAVPFNRQLVFDMEASPGVQIRNPWNFLGYSAVTFWYAVPGAISNRPALPGNALKPLMQLQQLDSLSKRFRR